MSKARMQIRKRKWRWMLASVLVCAILLLVWMTPAAEPDLPARATQVTGVQVDQVARSYGWLSEHELLLFHFFPPNSLSLARYDLATRKETTLTALSALYRKSGGDENGVAPRISRDGRHFLWTNRTNQVFCADLEGKTFSQGLQDQDCSGPLWLDNTHWAMIKTDKGARNLLVLKTHDIRPPYVVLPIVFKPPLALRSRLDPEYPRLTLTADHRIFEVLIDNYEIGQPHALMGKAFDISHPCVTQHAYSFPVSQKPCWPWRPSADQSPVNGRVAFALLYQPNPNFWLNSPLWLTVLHWLHFKGPPHALETLWVGDPATGQEHEIGHIRIDSNFIGYGPIGDVRWMPDGRHLSFLCNHKLYTISAD